MIRKSDKAADKLDAARAAVPKKQPTFHQPVNPLARSLQEICHAAHAKVHEVEQENVGVEAGPPDGARHGKRLSATETANSKTGRQTAS